MKISKTNKHKIAFRILQSKYLNAIKVLKECRVPVNGWPQHRDILLVKVDKVLRG